MIFASVAGSVPGLEVDAGTGIVSGKIAKAGTYHITLSARRLPQGKQAELPLTIVCAPGNVSPTPPMGWSAWSLYGESVTTAKIKLQADWLVKSGLAAHGFNYILLDDTWQGRRDDQTGSLPPNRRIGSIAALAEYCHARGLKFGIYSSPNAETPAGYAGSEGHEAQDAKDWASWGVDYVKYDWSDASRGRFDVSESDLKTAFGKMRKALDATNRDIHFAVTPYGLGGVTDWGAVPVRANSWWTSRQVIESWDGLRHNGFELSFRAAPAGPNHWNDPGWLLLGRVGNATINPHFTTLTLDEQKTQLSLWSLAAAPLILSCDLTQLDPNRFYRTTSALLTNDEVLDIDQDPLGKPATRLDTSGGGEVWARPLSGGGIAVGLFNRDGYAHPVSMLWSDLAEMVGGASRVPKPDTPVRDLWKHAPLSPEARGSANGGGVTVTVTPHGVVLLKVGGGAE